LFGKLSVSIVSYMLQPAVVQYQGVPKFRKSEEQVT